MEKEIGTGYLFLANPYSGTREEKNVRFQKVADVVSAMWKAGVSVVSTTLLQNTVANYTEWTEGEKKEHWKPVSKSLIIVSKGLLILALSGWENSQGIKDDIEIAKTHGLPVYKATYEQIMSNPKIFLNLELL